MSSVMFLGIWEFQQPWGSSKPTQPTVFGLCEEAVRTMFRVDIHAVRRMVTFYKSIVFLGLG